MVSRDNREPISHWDSREIRRASAEGSAEAARDVGKRDGARGLPRTIYGFIFRYSLKTQLLILALTVISFPFLYYSLDLPKTIINRAIGGHKFPQTFILWQLDQMPYLLTLCGLFLLLVFINGAFKFYVNLYKGQLGERMLRRLRYELYHRVLRFPIRHFKWISAAEIIPMITAEVEPLGGFIGDALVLPVFQGGTLLTIIIFMFAQDVLLGTAAVALYPMQGYVIPRLQRKINLLGKQRVRTVRQVADKVGETAAGIVDIHANDAVRHELAQFAHLLGTIYEIRFEIYNRKFFVKFLNNFIGQLTPFFFYAIGGYLVIRGNLSFGALVAVLAAYKDLASPWKELLDFYQLLQDSHIKYEQVIEQFQPEGLIDSHLQLDPPEAVSRLQGEVVASNVSLAEENPAHPIDHVSFSFDASAHVAIVGQSDSGKHELAMLLARLTNLTSGRITIGGVDCATLHAAVVGRRLGYVGATSHFFLGSLRDNLVIGLCSRPMRPREYKPLRARTIAKMLAESRQAGNIDLDIAADWVDYEAAGVHDEAELTSRLIKLLHTLDLDEDVYGFGLRGRVNPRQHPQIAERLLDVRRALAARLRAEGNTHLVEPFDYDRFNRNASIAENLLFGTPVGPAFDFEQLAHNTYVLRVLQKAEIGNALVDVGAAIAQTMVELFADLPAEHEFFEQYSFINASDLPEYQAILARRSKAGTDGLKPQDRTRFLSLSFKLVDGQHRLGLLDDALKAKILEARQIFAADLPAAMRSQIEFFDVERYNEAATVQDNLLFGKVAHGEAAARTRVPAAIASVLETLGLRDTVIAVGLEFAVGSGGSRLSASQRQKVAILRALIKRPDILILDEAGAALDGQTQAKVLSGIKAERAGCGLVWVVHRAASACNFDRVLVMSGGRLVEQGTYAELNRPGTFLSRLIASER
jgi:putative ABC transport system ATP-binding protein